MSLTPQALPRPSVGPKIVIALGLVIGLLGGFMLSQHQTRKSDWRSTDAVLRIADTNTIDSSGDTGTELHTKVTYEAGGEQFRGEVNASNALPGLRPGDGDVVKIFVDPDANGTFEPGWGMAIVAHWALIALGGILFLLGLRASFRAKRRAMQSVTPTWANTSSVNHRPNHPHATVTDHKGPFL